MQNEIRQSQTEMITKFKELMDGHTLTPVPTQSALLNSGTACGSSPAKSKRIQARTWLVENNIFITDTKHVQTCPLGQWDKHTSFASI